MHALFRDGLADRDYMVRYTDAPAALEAHLRDRSPMGERHHGARGGGDRGFRGACRAT